jgi:hypothetical protein
MMRGMNEVVMIARDLEGPREYAVVVHTNESPWEEVLSVG